MADPNQIEQELRNFLEIEDSIRKVDRLKYLMAIMNKHFELDKIDHMVNHYDFDTMMSSAKQGFVKASLPMRLSGKELQGVEVNYVLMLEAFVSYLNRNKLLKRLVNFDYRR